MQNRRSDSHQGPTAPSTSVRRGRMALFAGIAMALMVGVFASQAAALGPQDPGPVPLQSSFKIQNDVSGADDQPGQKDLNLQGIYSAAPGDLWVEWQWDDTAVSGGNTGDACALFDSGTLNGKVNFSVCATIAGTPTASQAAASPRVYTCGDGKVDRCTSTYTQVALGNTACVVQNPVSDPFAGVGSHKGSTDTRAICHIDLTAAGASANTKLVNTCSYPSQTPTSDPSDCVLIPADSFLKIVKNASPVDETFDFTSTGNATGCSITTVAGTGDCTLGIPSGTAFSVTEAAKTNWAINGTPSCTNSTTTGSYSSATRTISNLKAASDTTVTCTFNNVRQTGAIQVTKRESGTNTTLNGAIFTIAGETGLTTSGSGTVCKAGLTIGQSYNVTETTPPAGHSLASPATQSVMVTGAGTCASGATTATFSDPVVLGTVIVRKFQADGLTALNGATFTLHNDVSPSSSYVPGTDTATAFTCDVTINGTCSIFNVPLGNYWLVETTPPPGYTAASPQQVSIVVGSTAGNGVTRTVDFTDVPADGRINIAKTGLNGGALNDAQFTLYTDDNGVVGTSTGKSCTTGSSGAGACFISPVAIGNYWLVETVVPAGYAKAANRAVTVGVGNQPGQGATVDVTITDAVVPGTVSITKTDDLDQALGGAEFTLYNDVSASSSFDPQTDTITTLTCDTNASTGTCNITSVPLGDYWVVETDPPSHYDAAAPRKITVGLGASGETGDIVDVPTFVDDRQHRVVVLVCHEGTDTLLSRPVKLDGGSPKQSLAAGSLTRAQQKTLCDTGGASFGDISGHGTHTAEVDLAPAH
jgi:hypothetical protein